MPEIKGLALPLELLPSLLGYLQRWVNAFRDWTDVLTVCDPLFLLLFLTLALLYPAFLSAAAVLLVIPAYIYHWKPIKEVVILGELLAISAIAGLFLERNRFPGRNVLVALLTFPLAFPGVVVGFMVIMLAGRQGLIGDITKFLTGDKLVFAYSMAGLFLPGVLLVAGVLPLWRTVMERPGAARAIRVLSAPLTIPACCRIACSVRRHSYSGYRRSTS